MERGAQGRGWRSEGRGRRVEGAGWRAALGNFTTSFQLLKSPVPSLSSAQSPQEGTSVHAPTTPSSACPEDAMLGTPQHGPFCLSLTAAPALLATALRRVLTRRCSRSQPASKGTGKGTLSPSAQTYKALGHLSPAWDTYSPRKPAQEDSRIRSHSLWDRAGHWWC